VFSQIYDRLQAEKVDLIVHTGDVAHTKTQISPEYVEMCAEFFKTLAGIAPTYVIPGNHDGNLKNSSRLDALTPVFDALDIPELHLLKQAGEVKVSKDVTLNVLSVFDEDNWQPISDKSKINIALYHGAVKGSNTDAGYSMEHGDHDVGIFEGFDFVMLGDIHKSNQILDSEGRCRYAGSTVQQNHGETNDKGFLLWKIENKDEFEVEHVVVPNPSPFFTIELTKKGRIPKHATAPENARLRLAAISHVSFNALKKAVDVAKTLFKPVSVTYFNKFSSHEVDEDGLSLTEEEDLRDLTVQQRLIEEYLKEHQLEQHALERVIALNKKYNTLAEQAEDVIRNVRWSLKGLEWDNLFCYGSGNKVDFANLSGVVGIFGKNFTGKSSIIDSLLWVLHNSTSKNIRKNLDIINQNKDYGSCKLNLQVGHKMFVVERRAEKYLKSLHGEEQEEAKTEISFSHYDTLEHNKLPPENRGNLNGLTRQDTDKNIRRMFGTLDDFSLTSMTSQWGSLDFINEGSSKRKEILAKFLDLEIFDKKYKFAKEDASDLRGALKRLEGRDFDEEIEKVVILAAQNERSTKECNAILERLKSTVSSDEEELRKVEIEIAKLPTLEFTDEEEIKEELGRLVKRTTTQTALMASEKILQDDAKKDLKKLVAFLADFDIEKLKKTKKLSVELDMQLTTLTHELETANSRLNRQKKKAHLLQEVPCGDKFPKCKFLLDAHAASAKTGEQEEFIQITSKKLEEVTTKYVSLSAGEVSSKIAKFEALERKKNHCERDVASLKLDREKNKSLLKALSQKVAATEQMLEEFQRNREVAIKLRALRGNEITLGRSLKALSIEVSEKEEEMASLWKGHGSLKQMWDKLEEEKEELASLREEYSAFDIYLKCMHSNGISYDIIKRKLPIINEEISKVLSNVVDFEVFFEDDGKKLNIFIRHPKHPARPLTAGSGAEKTLAAMAIRLAMVRISNLPTGDLFILDEPATALDEDNMEGFIRIIDVLKTQFKTVIIVSHLDALKDIVDTQIVIDKRKGSSYVNA
jgi:DNA repair exonuclease SbcCD ATPase subunit/DNA repair exonuclease SbcCD nuclease subunit